MTAYSNFLRLLVIWDIFDGVEVNWVYFYYLLGSGSKMEQLKAKYQEKLVDFQANYVNGTLKEHNVSQLCADASKFFPFLKQKELHSLLFEMFQTYMVSIQMKWNEIKIWYIVYIST